MPIFTFEKKRRKNIKFFFLNLKKKKVNIPRFVVISFREMERERERFIIFD